MGKMMEWTNKVRRLYPGKEEYLEAQAAGVALKLRAWLALKNKTNKNQCYQPIALPTNLSMADSTPNLPYTVSVSCEFLSDFFTIINRIKFTKTFIVPYSIHTQYYIHIIVQANNEYEFMKINLLKYPTNVSLGLAINQSKN